MEFIRLEKIHKSYVRGAISVPVLKGVSLSIRQGEMVALMGASGSGKTTLINLMGFLDRPSRGEYYLRGQEVARLGDEERARVRSNQIGFVFQNFNLLPRMTALENVIMPLAYGCHDLSDRECRLRAKSLLERVGLGDRIDHEPARLSGGEQQRVAIARALINRCSLLIADEPTGNLDSKTGEEILDLFYQLNREDGLTIVLVTHDPSVAAHAGRIVRISDGILYEDDGPCSTTPEFLRPAKGFAAETSPKAAEWIKPDESGIEFPAPQRMRPQRDPMFLVRATSTAIRSLHRNALRSALTTLGIIIGVASLLAIAEIGKGAWTSIRALLSKTGVDNIVVQAGAASRNGVSLGSGSIKTLTPDDAESILHECASVDSLAPLIFARRQVVRGNKNWVPSTFIGTTPGYLRVRDWEEFEEGETFSDEDVREASMVCLLGQTVASELFNEESPVGQEVYVNDVPLRVVGVLSRKGADIIGEDQDDLLVAPWTTVKFRVSSQSAASSQDRVLTEPSSTQILTTLSHRYPNGSSAPFPTPSQTQVMDSPRLERLSNVDSILVRAVSTEEIPSAMEQIRQVLRERHRIKDGESPDFAVRDFTAVVHAVKGTVGLVAGLLLSAGLISLIVGGIGIMNVMLVTVTERYREIGLRMAVGARPCDILRQFLVEAVVLCVLGGAVGLALGRTASVLVRLIARWPTEASLIAVLASVSVSVTVGIIFGYYPAWKASRLDPIVALRFE